MIKIDHSKPENANIREGGKRSYTDKIYIFSVNLSNLKQLSAPDINCFLIADYIDVCIENMVYDAYEELLAIEDICTEEYMINALIH